MTRAEWNEQWERWGARKERLRIRRAQRDALRGLRSYAKFFRDAIDMSGPAEAFDDYANQQAAPAWLRMLERPGMAMHGRHLRRVQDRIS
jgi:hypothetical protein